MYLCSQIHSVATRYEELWKRLAGLYGEGEAKAIVRMLLEVGFGLSWTDIVMGTPITSPTPSKGGEPLADNGISPLLRRGGGRSQRGRGRLETMIQRLEQGEPVQYVLGLAEFGGRTLTVNEHVLIPRPETYELCQWVIETSPDLPKGEEGLRLLDIGTGSGCIACTLAAEMPEAQVTAWDISEEALAVARENAKRVGVNVTFERVDVLNGQLPVDNHQFDIIVSNPPYICHKERATMERNVLEHEPHLALFVPDNDPLLFYRAIAHYGQRALMPGGWLFFEINPQYADSLTGMLNVMLYHDIELKTDQFGKQRMIRAKIKDNKNN